MRMLLSAWRLRVPAGAVIAYRQTRILSFLTLSTVHRFRRKHRNNKEEIILFIHQVVWSDRVGVICSVRNASFAIFFVENSLTAPKVICMIRFRTLPPWLFTGLRHSAMLICLSHSNFPMTSLQLLAASNFPRCTTQSSPRAAARFHHQQQARHLFPMFPPNLNRNHRIRVALLCLTSFCSMCRLALPLYIFACPENILSPGL
jgi:hypothetical protein